jgi:hypothetical protein
MPEQFIIKEGLLQMHRRQLSFLDPAYSYSEKFQYDYLWLLSIGEIIVADRPRKDRTAILMTNGEIIVADRPRKDRTAVLMTNVKIYLPGVDCAQLAATLVVPLGHSLEDDITNALEAKMLPNGTVLEPQTIQETFVAVPPPNQEGILCGIAGEKHAC